MNSKFVFSVLAITFILLIVVASNCDAKSRVTERCYEVNPGLIKCVDSEGNTRTLINM